MKRMYAWLVATSMSLGACSGDTNPPARDAELEALCEQFRDEGCPIEASSLGYGGGCIDHFSILDVVAESSGCRAPYDAYLECGRREVCNTWAACEAADTALDECLSENPGDSPCRAACEASIAGGCAFTVGDCLGWCTRKAAERVLAGCVDEGAALDACQSAHPADLCETDACDSEASQLAVCLEG